MNATKTSHCARCRKETAQHLVLKEISSGAAHCVWWCISGDHGAACGTSISKEHLLRHGIDIEALPFKPADKPRCAKCAGRGAELHHWAPKELFGKEADNWPKDYLCKDCHAFWHNTIKRVKDAVALRGDWWGR